MIIEILLLIFVIFTDLYTKNIVFTKIFVDGITEKSYIPGFITVEKALNKGAAFGSFSESVFFIKVLPTIICLAFIAFLIYNKILRFKEVKEEGFLTPKYKMFATSYLNIALVFLIGGSIGNLFDRFFLKDGVRDFIRYDFIEKIISKSFAIGNVADIYVVIGVALLIIYLIKIIVIESKNGRKKNNM